MGQRKKIAVVGAGIIGICSAIECLRRGHQVSLIDEFDIAENCCSIGNTGHIAPDIFPMSSPSVIASLPHYLFGKDHLLTLPLPAFSSQIPWLLGFSLSAFGKRYQKASQKMQYLASRCIEDSFELFKKASMAKEIENSGCLFLYRTEKEFNSACKQWKFKETLGYEVSYYEKNEADRLEPKINTSHFPYAIVAKQWAKVSDPKDTLLMLYNYAQNLGVNFFKAKLTKF